MIHDHKKILYRMFCVGIILLGIVFYLYYGFYKILFINYEHMGEDFKWGYDTAQRYINENSSIYKNPTDIVPFLYPPLALILYFPFSLLPVQKALIVWFCVCHIIVIISAFIIYRVGKRHNPLDSATAIFLSFFFSLPLYGSLSTGNINIIVLLSTSIVYSFLIERKSLTFPVFMLTFCSFLKIYPALFMIAFWRNKHFISVALFLIFAAILSAISILLFGIIEHIDFLSTLDRGLHYMAFPLISVSFTYFIKLYLPDITRLSLIVSNVFFSAVLFSLWFLRAKKLTSFGNKSMTILDLTTIIVIMIMLFPSSWLYYQTIFCIPFYFIIFTWQNKIHPIRYTGLFIFLFFAINLWEVILFHVPVYGHMTIYEIGKNSISFPILYPFTYSLPFIFCLMFYFWLLINYDALKINFGLFEYHYNDS